MALYESFRVAIDALWANKLRAFLTMLGIIIGVSSVIIMVAIVQGARQKVISQVEKNGSNQIFAFYSPKPDSIQRGGFDGLRMDDLQAIQEQCTLIGPISPTTSTTIDASANGKHKSESLVGVLAAYSIVNNVDVESGRFITASDDQYWSKSCVIGHKVMLDLFGGQNPLGKTLVCDGDGSSVLMTVVGVLPKTDRSFNGDFDNSVFCSLRTVQKRFTGSDRINSFDTKSLDVAKTEKAADQVWGVLQRRHPLNIGDFVVDTQEGLLKQLDTFIAIFQLVLGGISGLSLLTGGIGIMNIMLVSVTERTREIGIRKAVGATRGAILLQFVVEAMVVSGLGGLIGVLQGWGVSELINLLPGHVLQAFVPIWGVVLGFGFSVSVGLFFGIYPAFRASNLDPITALRYE